MICTACAVFHTFWFSLFPFSTSRRRRFSPRRKKESSVVLLFLIPQSPPKGGSRTLPGRRREAAEKKKEEDAAKEAAIAAAVAAASAAAEASAKASFESFHEEEDEQLTMQVAHLHTEKVKLERRLKELERENDHLQGEVEVLYLQVDEQSGMLERSFAEAADAAVEDFILAGLEEDKKKVEEAAVAAAAAKAEAEAEAEAKKSGDGVGGSRSPGLGRGSGGGGSGKKPPLPPSRLGSPPPSTSGAASDPLPFLSPGGTSSSQADDNTGAAAAAAAASPALANLAVSGTANTSGTFSPELQRRQEELVESMDALRSERNNLSDEVAALRRELENSRHESAVSGEPGGMDDMLAKEVEQLLTRQAELASNLAQVRREKELLEGENEMLYAKSEADITPAPLKVVSERGTSPAFARSASPAKRGGAGAGAGGGRGGGGGGGGARGVERTSSPTLPVEATEEESSASESPRTSVVDQETSNGEASASAAPPPSTTARATAGATSWKSTVARATHGPSVKLGMSKADGPDAELAAKLIGRLNRAGESDEAKVLTNQVDVLLSQQKEMKLAMEKFQREKVEMEAEMGRLKEIESSASPMRGGGPRDGGRDFAGETAAATAAAEARIAAKESQLAMQQRNLEETVSTRVKVAVEEAEARRVEAEAAASRVAAATKEEAQRHLEAIERRLADAEKRAADAEARASAAAAAAAAAEESASKKASSSGDGVGGGDGIPDHIWNKMLADKETELGLLRAGATNKDKEIEALAARVRELEDTGGGAAVNGNGVIKQTAAV